MTIKVGAVLFVILVASAVSFAADQETLDQLIARANAAQPGQQPDLFLEIADREVKLAIESYKANKPEDGSAAVQQVVIYADKAHSLVLQSGKKLPRTEIKIRRMSRSLRDLKQNVEADDQPGVQAAIDKLETFRSELLKGMFGAKKPTDHSPAEQQPPQEKPQEKQ